MPTPTPWPTAALALPVAHRSPAPHLAQPPPGAGRRLRSYLLRRIPSEAPPHQQWPELRHWLASLTERDLNDLLDDCLRLGLARYRQEMEVDPEVERWIRALGTREPDVAVLSHPLRRVAAAQAVLASYRVASPEPALLMVREPTILRDALLQLLDDLWESAFAAEWQRLHTHLRCAADEPRTRGDGVRTVEELVVQVTGLQPLQQALDHLRQAREIRFLPCLHMGRYLSVSESGGCTYVLYDPAHDRSVPTQASQQAESWAHPWKRWATPPASPSCSCSPSRVSCSRSRLPKRSRFTPAPSHAAWRSWNGAAWSEPAGTGI